MVEECCQTQTGANGSHGGDESRPRLHRVGKERRRCCCYRRCHTAKRFKIKMPRLCPAYTQMQMHKSGIPLKYAEL